uniref:Zyg-11 family member, cell cycle regulator n=1 Tax=Petromyzon marinus TaxID=7757 RepID=S4R671_PETMA
MPLQDHTESVQDEGSPESLLDLCLGSLCWNLESMCTTAPDGLLCLREHVVFPQELADRLLKKLALADQLTDHTVAVFRNTRALRVRRACVRSARLSAQAFERSLARHPLVELDARGVNADITVMDVVRALTGARRGYTQPPAYNQVISLAYNPASPIQRGTASSVISLVYTQTPASKQAFARTNMAIEQQQLPYSTKAVTSPWCLKSKRLMFHSTLLHFKLLFIGILQVLEVLEELAELRHLDISDDKQFTSDVASRLLTRTHALPHLVSLDMSGRAGIADDALLAFRHAHPGMHFLGLLATDAGYAPFLSGDGTLKVTGEANENQITEALRRYGDRAFFIREALYHLFSRTPNLNQPRPDLLKLVADGMQSHSKNLAVQIAASACVFNLSKQELAAAMPVRLLSRVVAHTLAAMTQFPNHQQLQKNCLLSLCSDRILQDVPFDRFQAAKLVMQWLCNHDDQNMQRMAVAIISILAAKLSTEQTALLGSELLIVKKLLHIVEQKTAASAIDTTLKFTLSALWNLTDESPTTCRHFIDNQGLELFMRVLETFPTDPSVQQKVLGLLNNIAEVTELHPQLMRKGFIEHIGSLLSSGEVEVSYFAAGIIAHLTYRGEAAWRLEPRLRATLLQQL